MSRKASFDPGLILIAVTLLVLGGAGWLLYQNLRTDDITRLVEDRRVIRILTSVEQDGKPLFTEVVFYHPDSNRAALFDIPENLGAIIDKLNRVDRVQVLYQTGQIDAYRSEIEQLLGVSVPYHITLTLEGLGDLVDLLEGVEVFVSDTVAETREGESRQIIPSGNVHLDGRKVKAYVGLQSAGPGESQIERIGRHQKFLQSLMGRLGEKADYLAHPQVLPYLRDIVRTNLDDRSLLSLMREFSELKLDSIITRRVQGAFREVDMQGETARLLFPHFEGQWLRQTVRQVEQSIASTEATGMPNRTISVRILNGTTVNGLAARTRSLYEGYGFNVADIGNAENQDHEETLVVSHSDNTNVAQQVADIIRAERIVQRSSATDSEADVTVILGEDFDGTYVR